MSGGEGPCGPHGDGAPLHRDQHLVAAVNQLFLAQPLVVDVRVAPGPPLAANQVA